ncbi:hypothetical protein [Sphingomonas sp.]|uniref:hypothetical protein n=1 Tax=Sphingomonas sp. TaxID=28214 RepID=UPI00286D2C94|nr:hypothetical protein [Sphingomonas sp.]
MSNKPRPVTINSHQDSHGKITFDMVEDSKNTDTLVFNKTKDNMKKTENYDIHFTLVNNDGLKLAFVQDMNDVMWVAKGSKSSPPGCPVSHISDPEFTVTGVTAATLDVTNTDLDECKFKFVLNFIDTGNHNKAVQFDPIYDNQNGGFKPLNTLSSYVIIGGLAAAGALLVAMCTMNRMG